jgi:hypothetical protein
MFLKCEPNPHRSGRMTRTLVFEHVPGQRYAIDAEQLHKTPELLNAFGRNMYVRFRVLDAMAYMICLLGFLATIAFVWWAFMPGLAICVLMLGTNRKSAGEIARKAATRSVDNFRALHEMGCLWLVYA